MQWPLRRGYVGLSGVWGLAHNRRREEGHHGEEEERALQKEEQVEEDCGRVLGKQSRLTQSWKSDDGAPGVLLAHHHSQAWMQLGVEEAGEHLVREEWVDL